MSERSRAQYETAVATFVGVLALVVSAYTAYVQRQQVRAQVLPILQFHTSNLPHLDVAIDNKGVGPALIKHVVVTVDDEPFARWHGVLQKLMGPGTHNFAESDGGSAILSPNETVHVLTPLDEHGEALLGRPPGSEGARFDAGRARIGVEICYCSTLGDCWTLKSSAHAESLEETRRCPARSSRTFQQ